MASAEAELRLRERLSRLRDLRLLGGAQPLRRARAAAAPARPHLRAEPSDEEIWRSVELARHEERPYTLDYVERMLDDWVELHGDRGTRRRRRARRRASAASTAGRSRSSGTQKGRDIKERTKRNFGMALPRGLPQGDARDGARRPARLPGRHARRHARRLPGRGRRAARPGRRDRPLAGADGAARACRRSRASSARAAPAARSRSRSPTAC